ncbi:MAG: hypothetical protein SGI92_30815 [Bryobacteraceae bacterium]|nr:hypothetical protein [Bryobacteraceae bacterium]
MLPFLLFAMFLLLVVVRYWVEGLRDDIATLRTGLQSARYELTLLQNVKPVTHTCVPLRRIASLNLSFSRKFLSSTVGLSEEELSSLEGHVFFAPDDRPPILFDTVFVAVEDWGSHFTFRTIDRADDDPVRQRHAYRGERYQQKHEEVLLWTRKISFKDHDPTMPEGLSKSRLQLRSFNGHIQLIGVCGRFGMTYDLDVQEQHIFLDISPWGQGLGSFAKPNESWDGHGPGETYPYRASDAYIKFECNDTATGLYWSLEVIDNSPSANLLSIAAPVAEATPGGLTAASAGVP